MAGSWAAVVQSAFSSNPALVERIFGAANKYQGELPQLFHDIAVHIQPADSKPQTNSKKRKLEDTTNTTTTNGHSYAGIQNPTTSFECKNVSVQIPARKKLKLQIVTDTTDARRAEIRLLHPQTDAVEYALSNAQIDQAICLPVPEKQQRQWNFCIFPRPGAVTAGDGAPAEQIVFTMNEAKPDDAVSAGGAAFPEGSTYISATGSELNQFLHAHGKQVTLPNEAEFASSIPQPHRKGEKAYHVKAHRGSKEGYLFFLSNGIMFGFKKPLAFFPFSAIESISYTSVLQRTFNLVIDAVENAGAGAGPEAEQPKEIEFSMLDQADFAGIDAYVKAHGLNDASMAAERKAKQYNVNKEAKGEGVEAEGEADEAAEVPGAKTEQELQDEEDELEEDYEASGGESDGEGEDSEEEEEENGEVEEEYGEEGEEEEEGEE